jgi:N-acetylmuramoyl-L-alanine amidase
MRTGVQLSAMLVAKLLGGGAVAAAAASSVQLRHIDLQSGNEAAVLTLRLSAPTPAHVFQLHHPERVVIDLSHTRPLGPMPSMSSTGAVTALRSGWTPQHELRVVLALNSPMQLQRQAFTGGDWQLRIALKPGPAPPATPQPAIPPAIPPAMAPAMPAAMPVATPAAVQVAVPAAAAPVAGATPAASIRAAHAPGSVERPIVIAVDAGHGGDDPGATGQGGTHEKDVTLAIARALAARIDSQPGMRAVLTRDGDYFVDLVERRQRARAAHADMFVSIHADAIRDRDVSGASVYILSERGASSQAAKILAEEQNAADLKGGISLARQKPDLRVVLLDLSQSASMGESSEAADRVLNALDRVGAVRKREVQQAAFVVLKSPDIPSMLIETAYISNPSEERMLRTPAQQQRLAEAILSGIDGYFRRFPPEGSLFARAREQGEAGAEALARDGT